MHGRLEAMALPGAFVRREGVFGSGPGGPRFNDAPRSASLIGPLRPALTRDPCPAPPIAGFLENHYAKSHASGDLQSARSQPRSPSLQNSRSKSAPVHPRRRGIVDDSPSKCHGWSDGRVLVPRLVGLIFSPPCGKSPRLLGRLAISQGRYLNPAHPPSTPCGSSETPEVDVRLSGFGTARSQLRTVFARSSRPGSPCMSQTELRLAEDMQRFSGGIHGGDGVFAPALGLRPHSGGCQ